MAEDNDIINSMNLDNFSNPSISVSNDTVMPKKMSRREEYYSKMTFIQKAWNLRLPMKI